MDAWLEEDEEVFTHPRDPYHRIDVCYSRRHVKVMQFCSFAVGIQYINAFRYAQWS